MCSVGGLLKSLLKHSDVILAIMVVGAVAMLVLPLPTVLVDALLAVNFAAAVCLLLVATYVERPLQLSTLPSLLLLTTLFRLSLNVSTTRLILLDADAGQVIDSFGAFVVQGNYLVGGVIFLIITVIQFVVIARGSERVAEVAARFSLDSLPGKQLAIDADLRSGSIDQNQARKRRRTLQQESSLYGAMDGAMKFVKGDAIASLVIIFVNLIAGLSVGVFQRQMGLGEAAGVYTLLAIGDGLVTQIPSILIATSAGIVVTRVSSDTSGNLAGAIGSQLVRHPKAVVVTGGLMLLLGLLPGLPIGPFGVLGAILLFVGFRVSRLRQSEEKGPIDSPLPAKVQLLVGRSVSNRLSLPVLTARVQHAIAGVTAELGLGSVPASISEDQDKDGLQLVVDGSPIAHLFSNPANVSVSDVEQAVIRLVRGHAEEFLGIQDVQLRLVLIEEDLPALVSAAVPSSTSLARLTSVLRLLLRSGLSIRSIHKVLETMADPVNADQTPNQLAELARTALRRETSALFAEDGSIAAFLVDPEIEDVLKDSLQRPKGSLQSTVPLHLAREVGAAIKRTTGGVSRPFILTTTEVRPHLERVSQSVVPNSVVLSYSDLLPQIRVESQGKIAMGHE